MLGSVSGVIAPRGLANKAQLSHVPSSFCRAGQTFSGCKFARISDQLMKKRFSSAPKFASQEWW